MSVVLLDQLPSFHADTSESRPSESSNVAVITLNNIHQRSATIPGPVGALALDHFIYILIGVLVLLCCSVSIWNIFKAIISPRQYFKTTLENQPRVDVVSPYRSKQPPAPVRVNAIARDEVQKCRTQQRYQADGFLERLLVEKPNLPLPVAGEVASPKPSRPGTNIRDIEAWGNLVQQKKAVDITIANLERLAQAERRAGQLGAINPRLHAALQRRADIENSIKATYEAFKERRGEWSNEEWQVIELIMQYSPR